MLLSDTFIPDYVSLSMSLRTLSFIFQLSNNKKSKSSQIPSDGKHKKGSQDQSTGDDKLLKLVHSVKSKSNYMHAIKTKKKIKPSK